ncbi:MAG: matrixin family metalloprotease [Firmicutes bacterium]|nr:matrixin family metalloprotease [Bacillota bacterium]
MNMGACSKQATILPFLHEFGHVLGLGHVGFSLLPDTRAHMMYYTYTKAKPLHAHDIQALVAIYGP